MASKPLSSPGLMHMFVSLLSIIDKAQDGNSLVEKPFRNARVHLVLDVALNLQAARMVVWSSIWCVDHD